MAGLAGGEHLVALTVGDQRCLAVHAVTMRHVQKPLLRHQLRPILLVDTLYELFGKHMRTKTVQVKHTEHHYGR